MEAFQAPSEGHRRALEQQARQVLLRPAAQERRDKRIAKTRALIEHVFAGMAQLGRKALRPIDLASATLQLNWKVAASNLRRLGYLKEAGVGTF